MTSNTTLPSVAFCVLVSVTAAAGEVRMGLVAGPHFTRLQVTPAEEGTRFEGLTLAGAGAFVDFDLGERLSLHVEPTVLLKGSDFQVEPDEWLFPEGVTGSYRLTYLEVPAHLRVAVGRWKLQPYLLAGPSAGLLLAARTQAESGDVRIDDRSTDGFKSLDLAVILGAGVRFPAGGTQAFVEGRYARGLWSVQEDLGASKLKNEGVVVGVGLTFFTFSRRAAEPTATSSGALPQDRRGFWIGFSLGHGVGRTACGISLEGMDGAAYLGPCDVEQARDGGAVGRVRLGATVNRRVLVGAEISAWSGVTSPIGVETASAATTLGNLLAVVDFYPWASSGLFLAGGMGLSRGVYASTPRYGLGLTAGVGYDIRIGKNVSLTPSLSLVRAGLGDGPGPIGSITLDDMKRDVLDLSIGLTLH